VSVTDSTDANYCEPHLILEFESSGKKITFRREFPKLFSTLGELGGFADLMILVFTFLYLISRCYTPTDALKKEILGRKFADNRKYVMEDENSLINFKKFLANKENKTAKQEEQIR
jgi:hypothetical protein